MSVSGGDLKLPKRIDWRRFDVIGTSFVTLNGVNSGIWMNFGGAANFIPLPQAGLYQIDATAHARAVHGQTTNFDIRARLFDATAGVPVPNSEVVIMAHNVAVQPLGTWSDDKVESADISVLYQVNAPSNILIQAIYNYISGANVGLARFQSGTLGHSTLQYMKLD